MSKNRKVSSSSAGGEDRRREVAGVIGLGAGLFLLIAMVSLQAGTLVMGPFGKAIAGMFYGLAGICGYALIGLAVTAAIRLLIGREPAMPPVVAAGTLLGVVSLAMLVHLVAAGYRVAGHGPGGELGEHLAEILRAVISTAGTALLACVGLVIALVVATPLRMRDVLYLIGRGLVSVGLALRGAAYAFAKFWADVFRAILPERGERDEDDEEEEDDVLEANDDEHGPEPVIIERGSSAIEVVELTAESKKKRTKAPAKTEVDLAVPGPVADDEDIVEAEAAPKADKKRMAKGTIAPPIAEPEPAPLDDHAGPVIFEPKFKAQDKATMAAKEKQAEAERQQTFIKLGDGDYQLPSIQLLNYDAKDQNTIDKTAMLELSAKLTQTLENYGVKGDVVAIRPGPVVTMYEFAPAPGTRVNKIVNLTDDLALALEALRVRIVAPIPGKAAVGIEVPNKTREKVFLKEILADEVFRKARAKLPMAIGKDIEGAPFVVDMARMPHLLVAGTTGSGKSVGVNAMITSLLYHCSPEDVRLIMVDPKMLELSTSFGAHIMRSANSSITTTMYGSLCWCFARSTLSRASACSGESDAITFSRSSSSARAAASAASRSLSASSFARFFATFSL